MILGCCYYLSSLVCIGIWLPLKNLNWENSSLRKFLKSETFVILDGTFTWVKPLQYEHLKVIINLVLSMMQFLISCEIQGLGTTTLKWKQNLTLKFLIFTALMGKFFYINILAYFNTITNKFFFVAKINLKKHK